MNKAKKLISLLLAVLMFVTLATQFVACKGGNGDTETTTGPQDTTPTGKVTYTISLRSSGGMPLGKVMTYVYNAEGMIVAKGTTDDNGNIAHEINAGTYEVELSGVPDGYAVQERYPISAGNNNITLVSSIITDSDHTGVSYKLGDIMHEIAITLNDGTTLKLSEILKEKKMVMINFWYTTCTYCVQEFPGMNNAYNAYKDKIEILALNGYSGDSAAAVKAFQEDYQLDFPMAKDPDNVEEAFAPNGNPATVIIDRYGMISLYHEGAMTESQFNRIFAHYVADDYVQQTYETVDDLIPMLKPDVEMPSSEVIAAAVNKGEIKATYGPETESADKEYSWPFKVVEKDGASCIVPTNTGIDRSFATLHAKVELKAGEAFMFDYFASSEEGYDILYVLVDNDDIYQISGEEDAWKECCPWVADYDGVYDVVFLYNKNNSDNVGDDTVYLRDFRVVDKSEVKPASYIPREAATNPTANGSDYQTYPQIFLNAVDGYYHVGSENGPILLARLIYNTRFSEKWVSQTIYETESFMVGDKEYFPTFNKYCNYAANSKLYTYCSVTEELRMLLEEYVKQNSKKEVHENTWLQLCIYYDAYGQNEDGTPIAQLEDPIKGLSTHSAYDAQLGINYVEYQGMSILPRGYLYEFIPTESGVYRITSGNTDQALIGWIFSGTDAEWIANGDRILVAGSDAGERICEDLMIKDPVTGEVTGYDSYNVSMVAYMEAGKAYYIDIAYDDMYGAGKFTFDLKYVAPQFDYFVEASPGYFTFELGPDEVIGDTIAGGIDVMLGSDGYYYHKKADGSQGSLLYADFYMTTSIFTRESLQNMIAKGSFNFALSELDHIAIAEWERAGKDEDRLKELWGAEFEVNWNTYQMEDIIRGKYHGGGEDMTAEFESYVAKMLDEADYPERYGCVPVDARLAELLQILMDKYTFKGVDHSWTKLCYYYNQLGR